MMELMFYIGVFVYFWDIRLISKKLSGIVMVWYLMLVFYINKELIDWGNVMDVNGKEGFNKEIVKVMIGNVFILK